ncbi:hypothetical protein BH10PSE15_BH10PSE15_12540 [soil metagenome]
MRSNALDFILIPSPAFAGEAPFQSQPTIRALATIARYAATSRS